MKHSLKVVTIVLLIVEVLLASSVPIQAENSESKFTLKSKPDDYEEFYLKNSIPVFIKNLPNAKTNTVKLYFAQGSSTLGKTQYGYSSILMETLTTESSMFTEQKISSLMDETLSVFTYSALSDSCSITLTSLEKYFYKVLPVWESCAAKPSFSKLDKIRMQRTFELLNTTRIDSDLLLKKSSEYLCEKTNYFGKNTPTEESLAKLDKNSITEMYRQFFSNGNVCIIACGKFDGKESEKLISSLNNSLGKIKLSDYTKKEDFNMEFEESTVEFPNAEKNAVDFAAGYSKFPKPDEKLFPACYVAVKMYSDLLYNLAREKNGTVYSVYSAVNFTKYPVLLTIGYRISNREKFFESISEADKIFKSGKLITKSDSNLDTMEFADCRNKLESYKNIVINSLYDGVYTSSQVAGQDAKGIELAGNLDFMNDFTKRIYEITEEDLMAAIDYLVSSKKQWFYLNSSVED